MSTSLELTSALESSGALTSTGLVLEGEISRDKMIALGTHLGIMYGSMQFAIGDYLIEAEKRFGHDAAQIVESLNISHDSAGQYWRVAEAFPMGDRVEGVNWSCHRSVAHLSEDERAYYLSQAKDQNWTKRELEAAFRHDLGPKATKELPAPVVINLDRIAELARSLVEHVQEISPTSHHVAVPKEVVSDLSHALGIT